MKRLLAILLSVIFITIIFGAFFYGQQSVKSRIVEKIVVVTDTIPFEQLKPVNEQTPDIAEVMLFVPKKPPDTIFQDRNIYITQEIDTAAIIAEFIARREYFIRIDTAGVIFEFEPIVQFNRLQSIPYRLTRTDKEITTNQRERVVIPFVSVSCLTNNFEIGLGGGVFIRNLGFEYQYLPAGNRHLISVKRRF